MSDNKENNKSGKDKQVEKKQEPIKQQEEKLKTKESEDDVIKRSVRRLGNFLLMIIVVLIVGTFALLYYLLNKHNLVAPNLQTLMNKTFSS